MKKISYLGPKNTYTWQATKILAQKIDEKVELEELVSLQAVAKSVISKNVDMGVMPYYNYLEGLVQECLDLIYENNLRINGMQRLPIVLSIGAHRKGIIDEIYSHPKALAQCSEWLWSNYKNSKHISTSSTAAAAKKIARTKSGLAIASSDALMRYGLKIIAEDIGNKKNNVTNFTDFYLVARENRTEYDFTKKYLTMVAITPQIDKPGLLAEMLQQIAYYKLNCVKIHSRPALENIRTNCIEPQMFYLELMGHQENFDLKKCVESIQYKLTPKKRNIETVRVLGSYERFEYK